MPPAAVVALGRRALGSADHPLAQPAFRRLVIAHAVNVVGYWLYLTSVFTKVQELDGGALQISRIIALATIPLILFAPFTGLAIDRYGPKRALFLAYCAAALVLTGASFADSFAALYLAALCLAAVVALLRPAVFGLISRLVPSNQLAQANASLFAAGEAAIIAGPLLAAVLIRYAGTDVSFLTAGAALVGAALLLRRVPAVPALATDRLAGWRARITELAAGARTLAADRPSAVALACICTLFGFIGAIISLEPVLLKDELGAGRGALGIVYATAGAGSCASTAWLARRPAPPHPLPRIGIALALLGATTVGYSTSQTLLQAALWNFAVGLSFGWVLAPTVTVVQRRTPARVIGRVMAAFAIVQQAAQGLAALAVGTMAGGGVRLPMAVSALVVVASGVAVWLATRDWAEPPAPPGSPVAIGDPTAPAVEPDRLPVDDLPGLTVAGATPSPGRSRETR